MEYRNRKITEYRILPPKWRIVYPEGHDLPPVKRYLQRVDKAMDEIYPQGAYRGGDNDLVDLVFQNQARTHALSSHQLATLIVERYGLAEKHLADIHWRLNELLAQRPIRVKYARIQDDRQQRDNQRQILDLEKQKRDVQLTLWRDLTDLRRELGDERREYRATKDRMTYLTGGAYGDQ